MVKPASLGPFLSKAPIVKPEGATIARRWCREMTNRRYHTTRAKRLDKSTCGWSGLVLPTATSKQIITSQYNRRQQHILYLQFLHSIRAQPACMHSSNHRHHMTDTRCDLQWNLLQEADKQAHTCLTCIHPKSLTQSLWGTLTPHA